MFRRILFGFIMAFLFLSMYQSNFRFVNPSKLLGAYILTEDTTFSFKGWFSGKYQVHKEIFVRDSFGLRNIFIRIRNQVDFSVFDKANTPEVVIGKNNYLFDKRYIAGYYGTDFVGTDSITNVVNRLKFINDTLKKLNKTLLIVFAPDKAWFYPEYIPDRYKTNIEHTNYGSYLKLITEAGIDCIDFNSYFIANKGKSKYPLIPKYGVHWSFYGAELAGDSLISYLEKARHIKMAHPISDSITFNTDSLFDVDVENSMNLLCNLKGPTLAYPWAKFKVDSTITMPNVLIEGDSFYWGWQNKFFNIRGTLSQSSDFWYYFKKTDKKQPTKQELKEKIAETDVVIIISTTHNWAGIGTGFIENTYNMFKGEPTKEQVIAFTENLNNIKAKIKSDAKWLAQVKEDAEKGNISVDSAITLNAVWVLKHQQN